MRGDRAQLSALQQRDVVVIGGGQAGLAAGYYLRRTGLSYVLLDAGSAPGGAWRHTWPSLRLFSPAQWSSLPGRLMPGGVEAYPTRDEALAYLEDYERRYALPVERPVRVTAVHRDGDALRVEADAGAWRARAVISATGTYEAPYVPDVPGRTRYRGRQLHSAEYRGPAAFRGQRVLVVGGGNSGVQVLAEVSEVADTIWATLRPPTFLPDHIDGRYLFDQATLRWRARQAGEPEPPAASLGDVVMVAPVRAARERGVLQARGPVVALTEHEAVWADGSRERIDAIIWCTGFRAALAHLQPLGVVEDDGRVRVDGTRSVREPRLWLVGYGEWTGFASATLIAVGRTARATVEEIEAFLAVAAD